MSGLNGETPGRGAAQGLERLNQGDASDYRGKSVSPQCVGRLRELQRRYAQFGYALQPLCEEKLLLSGQFGTSRVLQDYKDAERILLGGFR
jgi:hypothetical protein